MTIIFDIGYLNEACNLSLNTSDIKYNMFIKRAQLELKELLGAEFYNQIVTEYPTYTGDNETLYEDYIKDFLAWTTYGYYWGMADFEATPTGIREFNDDNSSILSDVKKFAGEKKILEYANFYKNQLINFIKESKANDNTKFPLWEQCEKSTYTFGITAVDKTSDILLTVNKAIITNE